MDFPSPPPFNRLGVCEFRRALPPLPVLAFGSRLLRGVPACAVLPLPSDILFFPGVADTMDVAVPGLDRAFGGSGNAPMLIVFRIVFSELPESALPRADVDRLVGMSDVEAASGFGTAD